MTTTEREVGLPRGRGLTRDDLEGFPDDGWRYELLEVVHAPFAVGLADDTELQPDLLVAPKDQFTAQDLPGAARRWPTSAARSPGPPPPRTR